MRARRSRQYSAKYKLRILGEYEQLDKAGKAAVRREGLYSSLISEWRKQRDRRDFLTWAASHRIDYHVGRNVAPRL